MLFAIFQPSSNLIGNCYRDLNSYFTILFMVRISFHLIISYSEFEWITPLLFTSQGALFVGVLLLLRVVLGCHKQWARVKAFIGSHNGRAVRFCVGWVIGVVDLSTDIVFNAHILQYISEDSFDCQIYVQASFFQEIIPNKYTNETGFPFPEPGSFNSLSEYVALVSDRIGSPPVL